MIESLLFLVGLLIGAIVLFFIGQHKAAPIINEKNKLAMGLAAKTSELSCSTSNTPTPRTCMNSRCRR